jgi:hypothetical protein
VELGAELRSLVKNMSKEMHAYFPARVHPARQTVQRLPFLFAGGYLPAGLAGKERCGFEIYKAAD